MVIKTIGAAGDYTTIAAWSAYVKALVTLTEDEVGELIDDAVYTRGAEADLDFNSVTLDTFTITLQATTNKHDGDFGTGSRIEHSTSSNFEAVYIVRKCILIDLSFSQTNTSGSGKDCLTVIGATLKRVIAKTVATTGDAFDIPNTGSPDLEACRGESTGQSAFRVAKDSCNLNACSALNSVTGFEFTQTHTGTIKNNVAYNCTTDWSGTLGGATANNNASEDGTHPGTSGVTISGNPFDADGYTPTVSGQLDGAGVYLAIALDAANNAFNATPSIGAYEAKESSVIVTGTLLGAEASVIVSTGGTVIMTLTNDTWIAAGTGPIGTLAQTQSIIDGVTASTTPTNGWNNEIRDVIGTGTVVRTSDTVCTITIPATAAYSITADELITTTIPAAVLTISAAPLVTPTFFILYEVSAYDTSLTESVILNGLTIPPESMLFYAKGQHTGADNQSVLTDSTAAFPTDNSWDAGFIVRNTSKATATVIETAAVTGTTATTVTGTLSNGADWDTDNYYEVVVDGITAGCKIYYEPIASNNSFRWQLWDASDGSYSAVYTYTITV